MHTFVSYLHPNARTVAAVGLPPTAEAGHRITLLGPSSARLATAGARGEWARASRHREDHDDAVGAEWSSHGDWVECSTFGEGVVSTFVIGAENPEQDKEGPDVFGPDSWATWSGTSFAAPQIVGAIVRLMQDDGNLSPRDALDELLKDGTDIPLHGRAIKILPV